MVTANVDIAALKARHPLGDVVEASGVRLRGRGRVRQGVCPFHDEAEGSFTVYGDSERFYCFGCGAGGDVLDFIRRAENLSLPEAIERLGGGAYPAVRPPVPAGRPRAAPLPPRDPSLLTAAARFYAGQLRRSPVAREYLAARGVGLDAAARLGLGYAPGSGLRESLESVGFAADRLRDCGLFMERGAERFAGMVVVPDASGGLVRWLVGRAVGPDRTPRFQALPGPKPALGLGRLGAAPPWAVVAEGSSTGLPLPVGASPQSQHWAPRALSGSPQPCGAAPASSSPSTTTTRALRPPSGLRACLDAGPPPSPFPRASATWASLPPIPTGGPSSCACLTGPPAPPASDSPSFLSGPPRAHFPLTELARSGLACGAYSRLTHPHSHHPGGPMPMHDGLSPPTASRRACPVLDTGGVRTGHSLQEHTTQKENRHGQQERKQQRTQQRDRQRPRPQQPVTEHDAALDATHDPAPSAGQALLWDGLSPAVTRRPRTAPGPRAGLPAQGPRRAHLRLPGRPRRHRPGQPHLRLRRLGLRAGRRRDPAGDRARRHQDRRGEAHLTSTAPRCGSPSRARCPAPTSGSTPWPRTTPTVTRPPSRAR